MFVGCGTVPTNSAAPAGRDVIAFRVVASPSAAPLGGVVITAVSPAGVQPLGRSDRFGFLEVPADEFEGVSRGAVVFCHPDFFCGALMINDEFKQFREHLHALAPAMIQ